MTRPPGLMLLGTDTGVGKTSLARGLLALARRLGKPPLVPYKPVETGVLDPFAPDSDGAHLARASGLGLTAAAVRPHSFPVPVSPSVAAEAAGVALRLEDLVAYGHTLADGRALLVETAGGLLSPLTRHRTSVDLARSFGWPVVLVARNGLGTINHTALALRELERASLPVVAVILVTTSPNPAPDHTSNGQAIADLTGHAPLGPLPFVPAAASEVARDAELATALAQALGPAAPRVWDTVFPGGLGATQR